MINTCGGPRGVKVRGRIQIHRSTGSHWAWGPPSEKLWEDQRSDFELAGEEKTRSTHFYSQSGFLYSGGGGSGGRKQEPRVVVDSQKVVHGKVEQLNRRG